MTYTRVIPRDLFNEGDLLKMLGKFWILTESRDTVQLIEVAPRTPFEIEQDQSDGSISVQNVRVFIKNRRYRLYRPLNSREEWSLWITRLTDQPGGSEFEDFEVFDTDHGDPCLSEEMLQLIGIYN